MSLYGSVEARRTVDLWTLESPQIQTGLEQLGKPRGAFHAQSYVTGSSEALAALKQQAATQRINDRSRSCFKATELERAGQEERQAREGKAREERQAREDKARKERQEQAKIAFEEQQKKDAEQRKKEEEQQKEEEEAVRTTSAGNCSGHKVHWHIRLVREKPNRIRLVFGEQKDFMINAEVSNRIIPLIRECSLENCVLTHNPIRTILYPTQS